MKKRQLFNSKKQATSFPHKSIFLRTKENRHDGCLRYRWKPVGLWFVQTAKPPEWEILVEISMYHLYNSLEFTESLELVWPLAQDLELVERINGTQFPVWIFRLGILEYLSRCSVYFGNFPVGWTKIAVPFTVQPRFPDFFVTGKHSISLMP